MKPPDEEEPQRFLGFPIWRWPVERDRRDSRTTSVGMVSTSGKAGRQTGVLGGQRQASRPLVPDAEAETDEQGVTGALSLLVDAWCERRDLHALACILPAYTTHYGWSNGRGDLLHALKLLRADRHLPEDEQHRLERIIDAAERIAAR
jgi:hypothetical protein